MGDLRRVFCRPSLLVGLGADASDTTADAVGAAVRDGAGVDDILGTLTAGGLADTPSFLCAAPSTDGVRVLVRGDVAAVAHRDGSDDEEIAAGRSATWHDDVMADVSAITLGPVEWMPGSPDEPTSPAASSGDATDPGLASATIPPIAADESAPGDTDQASEPPVDEPPAAAAVAADADPEATVDPQVSVDPVATAGDESSAVDDDHMATLGGIPEPTPPAAADPVASAEFDFSNLLDSTKYREVEAAAVREDGATPDDDPVADPPAAADAPPPAAPPPSEATPQPEAAPEPQPAPQSESLPEPAPEAQPQQPEPAPPETPPAASGIISAVPPGSDAPPAPSAPPPAAPPPNAPPPEAPAPPAATPPPPPASGDWPPPAAPPAAPPPAPPAASPPAPPAQPAPPAPHQAPLDPRYAHLPPPPAGTSTPPPPPPPPPPGAAQPPPPPAPTQPTAPQPGAPQPPADEGGLGDHDGHTISIGDLQGGQVQDTMMPEEPGETDVRAIHCPSNHPNPPSARMCRICGQDIVVRVVRVVPRPVLARLNFDSGLIVELDRPQLMGRRPTADGYEHRVEIPNLITLPSPDKDLSRLHTAIHLEGWDILVEDLGSTNGTEVRLPGQDPIRLRDHMPVLVVPGTQVVLAGVVRFDIEVPT